MPINLALFFICELSARVNYHLPTRAAPHLKRNPQTILASGKYGAKRTIAVAGNQDIFMT
jgi:hypothetical protein